MSNTNKSTPFGISGIQEVTTYFSLQWLVLANAVGVLLAVMLIWPELNNLIAPFSYGRWIPLHMDWQLYGWSSLPLLGLIHNQFMKKIEDREKWVWISFGIWSVGLLAGGISWLSGGSTGKLFLNWAGLGGYLFAAGLLTIWSILLLSWLRTLGTNGNSFRGNFFKAIVLLSLVGVPFILLYTSDPTVYPPVNPNSGGATGHSLLASTLSLVFIMGLLPRPLLGLKVINRKRWRSTAILFWTAFGLSCLVYAFIDHGNASNYQFDQVLGLGTLLAWPILVALYWNQFHWAVGIAKWRWAFLFWWCMLAVDGWYIFLPGLLDVLKFTNALVGHSHLAMAGMVSALNMLILFHLGESRVVRKAIGGRLAFWIWNTGCFLYVTVMTWQGWREGVSPDVLIGTDFLTEVDYLIRLLAGGGMLAASMIWLLQFTVLSTSSVKISQPIGNGKLQ